MSTSGGYRIDKQQIEVPHTGRLLNMSQLGRDLLERRDPPIRSLYVYDCNPVATVPDQARVIAGLSRPDLFVVVHEQVANDTTDYADVRLPATTFLEHKELSRSYGGYLLQWATPAIPPVGESRANHAVFGALAAALGLDEPSLQITEDALAAEVVAAVPAAPADAWARLQADRFVKLPSLVQFVDVFPSKKISFLAADPPRYREPPVDADRPLVVISPASSRGISSTFFETLGVDEARVSVHPDDAVAYGLTEGAPARVWNSVGETVLRVRVDAGMRPGVAMIPKGVWRRSTQNGFSGNALVPDHVDERGGGACYNDARVSIAPVGLLSA
jgi:anaerobic selenocysteine-containing dehydrogenase